MGIADQMKGIYVVAVAVNNLEEAIHNYEKLGFKVLERALREEWGLEAALLDAGGHSIIELISPVVDKPVAQTVRKFLDRNGEGVYDVAVQVANVDAVHEFVKISGAEIVAEPHPIPYRPEIRFMWVSPRSAHGMFLAFLENPNR